MRTIEAIDNNEKKRIARDYGNLCAFSRPDGNEQN